MKKLLTIITILLCIQGAVLAQFYETGQDPGGIHWRQIKTEYFRLVFPQYAEKQAQHFAQKLLWAAQQTSIGLNHQPKRIDIIMHMEASTSNGIVIWAPKRMEAYNTPPQSGYSEDWWEQLALHEFRHVVQVDKMRQGFTKVLSFVFGEAATGGILGAYIPTWFLEGDAVAEETALSETGRGRDPDFSKDLKAQVLELGSYSYDKAYLGSYKNYIPNDYVLGYHLCAIGQKNYGNNIWGNSLDFSARNPYMIVPFSRSIKKQTKLNKLGFYSEAMVQLDSIWKIKQQQRIISDFDTLVKNTHSSYRSFVFPNQINDSTVICLMTGLDDLTRIVEVNIKTSKIRKLHTTGYGSIDYLSVSGNLVVWNERGYNPRWGHRKFMVIKTYNLKTKKTKQLSHRTRYYYPNFDSEAKRIITVEVTPTNVYNLVILDAQSGDIIQRIESDHFIKTPSFSSDGKEVFAIQIGPKGSTLVGFNIQTQKQREIFGPTYDNLGMPLQWNQHLVYISSKSGIANSHAYDTISKKEYQVTSVPYGLSNHEFGLNNDLVFNSYTSSGEYIARQDIIIDKPAEKGIHDDFYESYLDERKSNIQLYPAKDTLFSSKKYHKFPHLFKLHSWAPIGLNINNIEANPGFTFASQNLLGTMISTFGYEYRMNEQTSRYYANFSYKGWYPLIDFDVEYEDRAGVANTTDGNQIRYTYNSTNIGLSIIQPLNLTKGKYANYIQPSVGLFTQFLGANPSTIDQFPSGEEVISLRFRLYASHLLKMGQRDIEPRWGQTFDINYRDAPFNSLIKESIASAAVKLYFPGFGRHHTSRFYFAFQQKGDDSFQYLYSNLILLPRGYINIASQEFSSFRFDYIFPIAYPDFSLFSLAYFKRLKASVFYDYGKGTNKVEDQEYINEYQSIGLDFTTDLHFLRHMVPFEIGIRSLYQIERKSFYYEFLFAMNL